MTHSLLLPILAVVVLCVASVSGGYQLEWSHTGVPRAATGHLNSDAPPAPVSKARLPDISPPTSPREAPHVPASTPARDKHVTVRQFFDHEKDRYVTVDRILTTVYRHGRYYSETYFNQAHNAQVDLVLEELKPGDRYQIEIFWDDGSRRWFDETAGTRPSGRLYVDEPDPFSR